MAGCFFCDVDLVAGLGKKHLFAFLWQGLLKIVGGQFLELESELGSKTPVSRDDAELGSQLADMKVCGRRMAVWWQGNGCSNNFEGPETMDAVT